MMALQQTMCVFTVMIFLLCKGCHSQQPACGRAVKNSRISGGQDAPPGVWPWFADVHGLFRCGGALITNQWVLSLALCVSTSFFSNTVVYLGRHSSSGFDPNEVNRTVEDIICAPELTLINICLLKLSAPVNFTDYIQPICLASENSTFSSGTSSWVTGFGITGNGSLPKVLQEVNVPVVGNSECKNYYQNLTLITDTMICAGFIDGQKGICGGDFGAPLMVKKESLWVLSGLGYFGNACFGFPGVYIRVSQYQKWISETVNGTQPGFVTFTTCGTDSEPTTVPTTVPSTVPTTLLKMMTPVPTAVPVTPPTDDSVFSSSENLMHFTHSLCVLVVLLHVFVGSGVM